MPADEEARFRAALADAKTQFGPEHFRVAICLNHLARFLAGTPRWAEAEALYRRALAIDEDHFGPRHINVAVRLRHLAQFLRAHQRHAEAGPLLRRVAEIFEHHHGPSHSRVVAALHELTECARACHQLPAVKPLMSDQLRELFQLTAKLGQFPPQLAPTLRAYAAQCQKNQLPQGDMWRRLLELMLEAGLTRTKCAQILDRAFESH